MPSHYFIDLNKTGAFQVVHANYEVNQVWDPEEPLNNPYNVIKNVNDDYVPPTLWRAGTKNANKSMVPKLNIFKWRYV